MLTFKLSSVESGHQNLDRVPGPACDSCKHRRIKCDRRKPCGVCDKANAACSYTPSSRRRGRRPGRHWRRGVSNPPERLTPEEGIASRVTPDIVDLSGSWQSAGDTAGIASPGDFFPSTADWESTVDAPYFPVPSLPSPGPNAQSTPHQVLPLVGIEGTTTGSDVLIDPFPTWQHLTPRSSVPGDLACGNGGDLPLSCYVLWTRVFLHRLYPVFPVVDPESLLGSLSLPREALPPSMLAFFAAVSAAVIIQLNLNSLAEASAHQGGSGVEDDSLHHTADATPDVLSADSYVAQCLRDRQRGNFIVDADEWTVLGSFFLFLYHGNLNQSKVAWYYLREAIAFAKALGLDQEESYTDPDVEVNERRRRLFWLLFITER